MRSAQRGLERAPVARSARGDVRGVDGGDAEYQELSSSKSSSTGAFAASSMAHSGSISDMNGARRSLVRSRACGGLAPAARARRPVRGACRGRSAGHEVRNAGAVAPRHVGELPLVRGLLGVRDRQRGPRGTPGHARPVLLGDGSGGAVEVDEPVLDRQRAPRREFLGVDHTGLGHGRRPSHSSQQQALPTAHAAREDLGPSKPKWREPKRL
eukprot:CAMPEP_0176226048 /NCGR_PEP_ID=MMETSP0121_2-20121125/22066_1 /TAXON_ID=160619 /ORGANISM="Kryptoperidinium foliaceum, Strain CCMP 1326" /LENGTH=211 /DNA_ID=CAMNT_0017565315 /DNA_START=169 /DNA_END=800 /DNA_ORIENTATION=-